MVDCERSGIKCNNAEYETDEKMKIVCSRTGDVCYATRYCGTVGHVVFSRTAEYCKDRARQ